MVILLFIYHVDLKSSFHRFNHGDRVNERSGFNFLVTHNYISREA